MHPKHRRHLGSPTAIFFINYFDYFCINEMLFLALLLATLRHTWHNKYPNEIARETMHFRLSRNHSRSHAHSHLHSLTFIRIHTVPQHSHGIGVASASSFFSRPNCDKHSHAAAATKLQSRNRGGGVGEEGGMEPVESGGGVPSPGDS